MIAEQALRLVEVEWEQLPFVLDPLEAMQPGAPVLHPEIAEHNVLPPDPVGGPDVFLTKGDVEQGFAAADVVIEMDTSHHNPTQGSLDPWCCVAEWKDGRLTVFSNSYAADQTRMHVSQMLELPIHKVRVISKYVGGQFGRGDTGDQPFFIFTALLAKKAGRPVKFKHTRRDSFHDTRQRALYHCKVGRHGATARSPRSISSPSATSAPMPTTRCSRSSSPRRRSRRRRWPRFPTSRWNPTPSTRTASPAA